MTVARLAFTLLFLIACVALSAEQGPAQTCGSGTITLVYVQCPACDGVQYVAECAGTQGKCQDLVNIVPCGIGESCGIFQAGRCLDPKANRALPAVARDLGSRGAAGQRFLRPCRSQGGQSLDEWLQKKLAEDAHLSNRRIAS